MSEQTPMSDSGRGLFDEIFIRHACEKISKRLNALYCHAEQFTLLKSTLIQTGDLTEEERASLMTRSKHHRLICNALIKDIRREAAELPDCSKELHKELDAEIRL